MEISINGEIRINGKVYVEKSSIQPAINTDGLKFVVIRTYSAGVHAGWLKRHDGKEVELLNAVRMWRWRGAFTLSEIAMNGLSKQDECKFAMPVDSIILTEAIEVIPCRQSAMENILAVQPFNPYKDE